MSYKTGFYEGRLGIGLDSTMGMGDGNPRYPLDINGDIRLTGSIVNGDGQVLSLVPAESLWTIGNNNLSYAGGNVGIGTTSPSTLLVVGEDGGGHATNVPGIHMKSIVGQPAKCYVVGQDTTHNVHLGYWANSTVGNGYGVLSCYDGSNHLALQHSGGNVGIGTTSPEYHLDIRGSGNQVINVYSDGTGEAYARFSYNNNATSGGLLYVGTMQDKVYLNSRYNYPFVIYINNSERLRLDTAGNLGIGTTSPDHKLHIDGGNTGSTTFNDVVLKLSGTSTKNNGSVGMLFNMREGASGAKSAIFSKDYAGTWNRSSLVFCTNNDTNSNDATLSDARMVIRETGNVGIGTTNPGYKLHIVNPTLDNSIQDLLCLETHVSSQTTIGPGLLFRERWNNGSYFNLARILGMEQSGYGGQLAFFTNLGDTGADDTLLERMRIDENGNVGIGTTSPGSQCKLQVYEAGTEQAWKGRGVFGNETCAFVCGVYHNKIQIGGHNGALNAWYDIAINPGGGNVGIGTASPAVLLDVDGHAWCRTLCVGSYGSFSSIDGGDGAKLQISNSAFGASFGIEFSGYTNGHRGANQALAKIICWSNDSNNYENHLLTFKIRGWGTGGSPHHNPLSDRFWFYGNGNATGSAWNTTSDDRVKHNERNITNAMNIINKLNAKLYFKSNDIKEHNYEYDLDNSGNPITDEYYRLEAGFIAQEVREISELKYCVEGKEYVDDFENCFTKDASGNNILDENNEPVLIPEYLGCIPNKLALSYNDIFVYNVVATQELDRKVIALENENAELKAELVAIKQHLGI